MPVAVASGLPVRGPPIRWRGPEAPTVREEREVVCEAGRPPRCEEPSWAGRVRGLGWQRAARRGSARVLWMREPSVGAQRSAARELTDGEVAEIGLSPRASACEAGDGPDAPPQERVVRLEEAARERLAEAAEAIRRVRYSLEPGPGAQGLVIRLEAAARVRLAEAAEAIRRETGPPDRASSSRDGRAPGAAAGASLAIREEGAAAPVRGGDEAAGSAPPAGVRELARPPHM